VALRFFVKTVPVAGVLRFCRGRFCAIAPKFAKMGQVAFPQIPTNITHVAGSVRSLSDCLYFVPKVDGTARSRRQAVAIAPDQRRSLRGLVSAVSVLSAVQGYFFVVTAQNTGRRTYTIAPRLPIIHAGLRVFTN